MQQFQVRALTRTHHHGRVCGYVITKTIITIEVKSSVVMFLGNESYATNMLQKYATNMLQKYAMQIS